MNIATLKEAFFDLVSPDLPNEWDVEEAMETLSSVDEEQCLSVLKQVPVIWPVSHSLCFDYLKTVPSALACFKTDSLSEWVNSTLDQYEKDGLRAAQRYMADVEKNFLCPLQGESGVTFKQVRGHLLPYLRGLSGRPLDLASDDVVYTDTTTVFVPHEISLFPDNNDNIFLFKLIVTYQWAFIACSSFTVSDMMRESAQTVNGEDRLLWLQDYLGAFSDPLLASDLYHLLETVRMTTFLENELPGLMRRKVALGMKTDRTGLPEEPDQEMMRQLQRILYAAGADASRTPAVEAAMQYVRHHRIHADCAMDSVKMTEKLYSLILQEGESYTPVRPLLHQGYMRLDAVRQARDRRLAEAGELFIAALTARLLQQKPEYTNALRERETDGRCTTSDEKGHAVVVEPRAKKGTAGSHATVAITIDNEEVRMDAELRELAADIISDLGFLPEQYVSSAAGRAGKGYAASLVAGAAGGTELAAPIIYDEWDYRRHDYRKNWCSIREKEIPLSRSSFYSATVEKYHGQITRLRYQFEMMRTSERFVRRQRDGDDIDLDALIESVADARAGLAPTDRLFIRLKRDERDIAVLFLVDMSNSTQGWVNQAIKESLVLLCEALEVVGDRYAIYGFSGMRRLRSDFFHIKHLDEPYGTLIKERITSIAPREYTRMGTALRHATSLLKNVDSRVRLLITLSDGKPEDYDDYKGEYAIEDTRHALIEAKAGGIHPFCITVDKHARNYIEHMYGSVNYIQIDEVKKLPHRMLEVYRVLTS